MTFLTNIFRRFAARRQLRRRVGAPAVRTIEGVGDVHVYPMLVPMRMVFQAALATDDAYDLYCWLIHECVYEFAGRLDIGVIMDPSAIEAIGDAVLDVSGLTKASQEAAVKKLEASQDMSASGE